MVEEFDPSGLTSGGHSVDIVQLRLELYRLVSMILASRAVAEMEFAAAETYAQLLESESHWMHGLGAMFCQAEVSRILILSAVHGRILSSSWSGAPPGAWNEACGEIEEARKDSAAPLGRGPLGGTKKPLALREAFNKILHCEVMNPDTEEVDDLGFFVPRKINPIMYLYGRQMNGRLWRTTLDIMEYVRLLHLILPRE